MAAPADDGLFSGSLANIARIASSIRTGRSARLVETRGLAAWPSFVSGGSASAEITIHF